MKLGIVVNKVGTRSEVGQTTYRLALDATRRGHEVFVMSAGGFSFEDDGRLMAKVVSATPEPDGDVQSYMRLLVAAAERPRWIDLAGLDVLLLRNNPSVQTAWAQQSSLHFGRLLVERGVLVLNDPEGLAQASSKLYLMSLPEEVRPLTLVTRNFSRVKRFAAEQGALVLKPLVGSGGKGVFVLRRPDSENLEQIFRAVARDGYVMVQEYLEQAVKGDTRVFMVNGVPLARDGHFAAVRRVPEGEDPRSNVHVGARIRRADVDENIQAIARAVQPRLVADGMFFVGLDVVGDKIMEVNVFTPGGLGSAQTFEKVDFTAEVVDAIERKLALASGGPFVNAELATRDD